MTVEIKQCDRELVANIAIWLMGDYAKGMRDDILAGKHDDWLHVVAIAEFRLAAEQRQSEPCGIRVRTVKAKPVIFEDEEESPKPSGDVALLKSHLNCALDALAAYDPASANALRDNLAKHVSTLPKEQRQEAAGEEAVNE